MKQHKVESGLEKKLKVKKRDGEIVRFNPERIATAIYKAAKSVGGKNRALAKRLADGIKEHYLKPEFYNKGLIPGVEEIQNYVEKELIETGHAKTAKAYILYRQKHAEGRDRLSVHKPTNGKTDSTDISLLVNAPSGYTQSKWDRKRISEAIVKEAKVPNSLAKKIAKDVETKIIGLGYHKISTPLIRELVDTELFLRGEMGRLKAQQTIGMPMHDLEELIFSKSSENSNIGANNPEAINLSIAENTIKQFMLTQVFSEDVSDAHLSGLMHIHDMGYPRAYCSSHSLEYLKKYGLKLENLSTESAPPNHARVLTGHLNTFLASMQAYYAGALGIGFLNIFYAPFLEGMSQKEMKQEAQYLIFSGSQNAFSRGGQTLFIDANVHLGIPDYLKDIPAIGPKGKYTGKTYKEYEKETQMFARALMEVWKEGDRKGHPFSFPKLDLHIDANTFSDPNQFELFKYACEVASDNGTPYFFFDRGSGATLSQCCRLRTKVTDPEMLKHPESLRFCGFQNITINLPQCAYKAGKGNIEKTLGEIDDAMDLAMKAHLQKKKFIGKLMSSEGMPLWQVGMPAKDGKPYVDLEKSTYIIGLIGMNECVQYLTGQQLHESDDAFKLGLKIASSMYLKKQELEKKSGLHVSLEESPAESAARRLAKVDLREYPLAAKEVVKGDIQKDTPYYTNSIHFAANAPVSMIERIIKQSKFHPIIEAGAIVHAFVGEYKPSPESIANLVEKTYNNTQCAQLTISPEFTICKDCDKMERGIKDSCSCGSKKVYGLTRIVGYFSKTNNWNKSKLGELKDRQTVVHNYQVA